MNQNISNGKSVLHNAWNKKTIGEPTLIQTILNQPAIEQPILILNQSTIEQPVIKHYICILDFEATCWDGSNNHEIIEFPSVLLGWNSDGNIIEVGRIQLYVKPRFNPSVSKFCFDLTGITQETVNAGIDLKQALKTHSQWLQSFAHHSEITMVTCGHWDLKTMLPMDLKNIKMKSEPVYNRYVNLKDLFKTVTNTRPVPMTGMLNHFKLKLEGRHHSGLDDCHNLARVFIELVNKGMTQEIFLKHLTKL